MRIHPFAVGCALTAFALPAVGHAACVGGWDIVPTANPSSTGDDILKDIAGVAGNNIWAVGQYAPDSNPNVLQTLIEHWDGSTWKVVPSPNQTKQGNALLSVAVAASGEAWATGYATDAVTFYPHSLIEHWNGTAWQLVPHPTPGISDQLIAVAAVSPTDVWAVGTTQPVFGLPLSLIEHFDGTRWSRVDSPDPGATSDLLYAVTAVAADNVWAAGQRSDSSGPDRALLLHWDGHAWTALPTPHYGTANTALYAIKPEGPPGNIVAVGEAQDDIGGRTLPLIEGGNPFAVAPVQFPARGDVQFYGLSIGASTGAWAVGTVTDWSTGNPVTYAVHRPHPGEPWPEVATPNPAPGGTNQLGGVSEIGGVLWVVGSNDGPNAAVTLAMRRCE